MNFRITLTWTKGCKRNVSSFKSMNRVHVRDFKNLIEEKPKRDASI